MAIASADERYMLTLINEERTSRGLDPLQLEQNLNQSSEVHSEWMLQADVFSHTGAGGSSAGDRMRAADFDFSGSWRWAENLAVQSERGESGIRDDVRDLHNNLMNSPGHRANILNPDLDYVGIGIERGNFVYDSGRALDSVIVTQNFASTGGSVDLDLGGGSPSPATVTASFTASNDINGTSGANRLAGTIRDDVINGFGGNDRIYAGSGNDRVNAGSGNDKVYDGAGADTIILGAGNDYVRADGGRDAFHGGSGRDEISYARSGSGVRIDLQNDIASGGMARDDTISGFENVAGSNGGGDRLSGNSIANKLRGLDGNDILDGRAGNDRLYGGNGNDRLDGGTGRDYLFGGNGADVFHFDRGDGRDTIKDFRNNVDTIQLDNFNIRTLSQAFDRAEQVGSDVVFTFGTDQLRIEDVTLSQLGNDLVLV